MIKWEQTAKGKTQELRRRIYLATGDLGYAPMVEKDAETLRRAELTLAHWAERECGWNTDHASVQLVRDEATNIPYHEVHMFRSNDQYRARVNDLETGALRRVAEVCKRNGLEFFHQGDPRGCSLYIANAGDGMNDTNYSSFVPCFVK